MGSYAQVGKELSKPTATAESFSRALGRAGYVSGKSDSRYETGVKPSGGKSTQQGTTLPSEWRRSTRVTISALKNLPKSLSQETQAWAAQYAAELGAKLRGR